MKVGKYRFEASNLDKVLFPEEGITKGDLIGYYTRIAPTMLPYLAGRPISMQRFPNGIEASGFYQKEVPDYFPDWIDTVEVEVEEDGEKQPQVVISNAATLAYLANQACITPHTWLSCRQSLDKPDLVIFDLDPPEGNFELVREGANALHRLLEELDLVSYPKTTGSRGLHVTIPIRRELVFDEVRDFSRDVAEVLANRQPDHFTVEMRKADREGRLFLDYLRNSYAQTAVPPYAVRAKPGAPIATPLDWEELGDSGLNAQTYTIANIFRRLGQKDDPWKGIMEQARSLKKARKTLDQMRRA